MSTTERPFWVYILQNQKGRFYIGYTDNTRRRLSEHNDAMQGAATFTHKNGPWVLVWSESHGSRAAAMAREKAIKSMKSARWIRENLLNGRVPTVRD